MTSHIGNFLDCDISIRRMMTSSKRVTKWLFFFQKRGYPFYIIEQAKCKCTAILQSEALKGKNEGIIDHPSIIPLVPFHYLTIEIATIVQKKCESCQQLKFWSSFLGKNRHYIQFEQNHKQVLVRRKLKNGKLSGIMPARGILLVPYQVLMTASI